MCSPSEDESPLPVIFRLTPELIPRWARESGQDEGELFKAYQDALSRDSYIMCYTHLGFL